MQERTQPCVFIHFTGIMQILLPLKNAKVSFHKKLFLRGAAQERCVGRHRPHSKKNQNKILTDADQSSLLSSLPPTSLSLALFLCLTHMHTNSILIQ